MPFLHGLVTMLGGCRTTCSSSPHVTHATAQHARPGTTNIVFCFLGLRASLRNVRRLAPHRPVEITSTAARASRGKPSAGNQARAPPLARAHLCFFVPDAGRHAAWSAFSCAGLEGRSACKIRSEHLGPSSQLNLVPCSVAARGKAPSTSWNCYKWSTVAGLYVSPSNRRPGLEKRQPAARLGGG